VKQRGIDRGLELISGRNNLGSTTQRFQQANGHGDIGAGALTNLVDAGIEQRCE
jgi:hypothetical protein